MEHRDESVAARLEQLGGARLVGRRGRDDHHRARSLGLACVDELEEHLDRIVRLAQSEVTKLALYLDASPQAPRLADEEALDAIGARTEEDGMMPLVNAVLSGEVNRLPGELRRMREVSLNPVGVLLAFERRAAQLAQLAGRLEPGGRVNDLLDAEQKAHRVFWRDRRDLSVQLQRWNASKVERLVQRLANLHRALLANSQAAELLLAQELAVIARHASARA